VLAMEVKRHCPHTKDEDAQVISDELPALVVVGRDDGPYKLRACTESRA
jgi:hypothetical protein